MALQRRIALEQTAAAVGKKIRVLVESPGIARSEADAPDVDARVFVPESLPPRPIRRSHRSRRKRIRFGC